MLPLWIVLPPAAATLLVIAAHLQALRTAPMPESRRRIRQANGVLMLVATPLVAYLFGVAQTGRPRSFLLISTTVVGLLAMILLLSGVDIANTWRLHRREMRALRREVARELAAAQQPGRKHQ